MFKISTNDKMGFGIPLTSSLWLAESFWNILNSMIAAYSTWGIQSIFHISSFKKLLVHSLSQTASPQPGQFCIYSGLAAGILNYTRICSILFEIFGDRNSRATSKQIQFSKLKALTGMFHAFSHIWVQNPVMAWVFDSIFGNRLRALAYPFV